MRGPAGSSGAEYIGRTFGEFVVREQLGSGGFGTVFRAEQPALDRQAVIKVLHTRLLASETLVQRFLREARLASRLDHPYAAHTYAFGAEPDGVLWIAMEYVRGTPLDRLLEVQGPIPLERFVPLLERICEVVHTAHEQGIVHRDLKPANVMVLTRAGRLLPKLLDLGIAKLDQETPSPSPSPITITITSTGDEEDIQPGLDDTASAEATMPVGSGQPRISAAAATTGRLTSAGAVMGSPLYMAPEQWSDAATADARTDLYALGVVSYECLTGRPPFEGGTQMQLAVAHARQPPPPLGRDLPPALDAVLARAMAKDPAERHATALELAAAFRAASGVAAEPAPLPRLDDALRAAAMTAAPRPLALALDLLDGARNAHQARDALWRVVHTAVRLVGVIALASHAHVGADASATDPHIAEGLRALRGRTLSDAAWLDLARDLVAPFAHLRDAHPVPALVELLDARRGIPTALADLVVLRRADDEGGARSDDRVRELLERALPLLARALEELAFLHDYPIATPLDGGLAEDWTGLRRTERRRPAFGGRRLVPGHPVLLDADGTAVLSLWPFVQAHEPAPGAPAALFFFEGKGRRGARLVALPEAFEREDEELLDALGSMLRDSGERERSTGADEASPWPGLAAFTADDAASFIGRERETEAFLNRLRVTPLLAVVGPSGAGKSSFVQAGVVPAMPEGWRALTVRPGPTPLFALAARLTAAGLDAGDLPRELVDYPGALGAMLRVLAGQQRGTVVLVVDQLEELFTLCDDEQGRQLFADALARAARTPEDPVRVVFTLRDDFLLRAEALTAFRLRLAPALQLLATPAPPDLKRILTLPVQRAGYEFDDASLPDEMVEAVASAPGALALLSFTASRLWELRDRRFRQIAHKAYRSLGGVGGALAQHAETVLQAMTAEEQRLVREVFRHAVTAEGTRAVLTRDELDQLLGGESAGGVVEKLIAARLLVTSETESDRERIEIIHEALLSAWPRLVTWRREDAEGTRLRDQLRAAVRQWEDRGRPSGLLWRGDALAEFRQWRARFPGGLTTAEEAFAAASLADAARGRRLRRLLVAGAMAALAAVAVVLLFQNARVARQRERAQVNERAANASAAELNDLLRSQYESQARRLFLADDPLQALAYLDQAARRGAAGPVHDLLVSLAARATEGEILRVEHEGLVIRVRYSPDGARLATAGYDGRVRIWDAHTGAALHALAHGTQVVALEWTPDGTRVISGSVDETVVVWDAASGRLLHALPHGAMPQALATSPDGARLLTCDVREGVRLWDLERGAPVATLHAQGPPSFEFASGSVCDFAPDGATIAAGDRAGTVRTWDARSGRALQTLAAHDGAVTWVRFARDGRRLLVASSDHTASVWDAGSGRKLLLLRHQGTVHAGSWSPDGAALVTASADGSAILWRATDGQPIATLAHQGPVRRALFSPDGSTIVTTSEDSTAQLWDAHGRRLARRVGHGGLVGDVSFHPSGLEFATSSFDRSAIVWSSEPTYRITQVDGPASVANDVALTPDGAQIAIGAENGTTRICDARTGRELHALAGGGPVHDVQYSPDGELVAAGGRDRVVRVWDTRSGRQLHVLEGHRDAVHSIDWAQDGARIVTASEDGTIIVWSATTWSQERAIQVQGGKPVLWVRFLPGASSVISFGDDLVTRVHDVPSGRELRAFPHATLRINGALEPSGRRVAAPTLERSVEIVDTATGAIETELRGHLGLAESAEFIAGGMLVATGGSDRTVRLWSAATGDLIAVLPVRSAVKALAMARDGRRLAIAYQGGGADVWELPVSIDPAHLAEILRCRVPYAFAGDRLVTRIRPPDCTPRR